MTIVQMAQVDPKKEIMRAVKKRYKDTEEPVIKNWIRNELASCVTGKNKTMSRNTFLKHWNELKEKGELEEVIVAEKGRVGWLPTQIMGKPIREYIPKELKNIEPHTVYKARKDHTEKLKPVLLNMKKTLLEKHRPLTSPRDVFEYPFSGFEGEWKFKHLREHIPQLMKKWVSYKKELLRQYKKTNQIMRELGKKIAETYGIEYVLTGEVGIQPTYPEFLVWAFTSLIRKRQPEILEGAHDEEDILSLRFPGNSVEEILEKFKKIPEGVTSVRYSLECDETVPAHMKGGIILEGVKGYYFNLGPLFKTKVALTKIVIIIKEFEVTGSLLQKLNHRRRKLADELKKSDLVKELKEFLDLGEKLEEIRNEIIEELDKYLSYSVLPQYCDVIIEAVKS